MNSKFEKPSYSNNGLKLQLINTFVGNHDLVCGCTEQLQHIKRLVEEELNKNKTCLSIIAETTGDPTEEIIGDGELDALFEKDFEDEG